MFENYTEKGRRVIFFGRYEASQIGSEVIEPEHLLLGLLREDRMMFVALSPDSSKGMISTALMAIIEKKEVFHSDTQIPFSDNTVKVLENATNLAKDLSSVVHTSHILWAIVQVKGSVCSQFLLQYGITPETVQKYIENIKTNKPGNQVYLGLLRIEACRLLNLLDNPHHGKEEWDNDLSECLQRLQLLTTQALNK